MWVSTGREYGARERDTRSTGIGALEDNGAQGLLVRALSMKREVSRV